ncbi:MAG: GTPase ObgE [Firmicutes bacterium]|nr:GTPase ObgE [Bacillota bacterium]
MFVDKVKIFIKAGEGGNGCVSFYTEKHRPLGGPDGGDGGKGGDIVFAVTPHTDTLASFDYARRYIAESGFRGDSSFCNGKSGKDLVIQVPRGTIVRDEETGGIIADMFDANDRIVVLKGGSGGKGNARFKTSRRKTPRFSQTGQKTTERAVILELKTIAEAGLVGYPNAGKSTLLSVISAARPKIAGYHFTTITPNLGVVKYYDKSFVVADIPGLIEGASDGAGLGIDFLRHIERVRLIVHIIDVSGQEGRDPYDDYLTINKELKVYSKQLGKLKQIIVLNKADLLGGDDTAIQEFKSKLGKGKKVMIISGITGQGVDKLKAEIAGRLAKMPPVQKMEYEPFEYAPPDTTSFEIAREDDGAWVVYGGMIDELARNVVLDDFQSFSYMQKFLKDGGVFKELTKQGLKEGDTVRILDTEFEYVE